MPCHANEQERPAASTTNRSSGWSIKQQQQQSEDDDDDDDDGCYYSIRSFVRSLCVCVECNAITFPGMLTSSLHRASHRRIVRFIYNSAFKYKSNNNSSR